jgi:glycyl-tRNA synthetase
VYLRPETAQGIFVVFANTLIATRRRLPFGLKSTNLLLCVLLTCRTSLGLGQIGRSFRNEVSPANFLFRMREFEQMELEYFCAPADAPRHFDAWVAFCEQWLLNLGLRAASMRKIAHPKSDLAHYAVACTDVEFLFAHGWGELWGIANRYVQNQEKGKTSSTNFFCQR